jgi:hypothetical protein
MVGTTQYLTYQVQDTVRNVNISARTGDTGIWVNPTELYPNDPDLSFNSESIGGTNLIGTPVRHHKMPTIKYIAGNIQSISTYGVDILDTIGLEITNIIIPVELTDIVDKVEIFYAKRNNPTQLGMSLVVCSADASNTPESKDIGLVSTGGNFSFAVTLGGNQEYDQLDIHKTTIRFYSFDMLFNRPGIPDKGLLDIHYKLRRENPRVAGTDMFSFGNSGNDGENPTPYVQYIDYFGFSIKQAYSGLTIRELTNMEYVTNNANTGRYNNTTLETFIGGRLPLTEPLVINTGKGVVTRNGGSTSDVDFEEAYCANIASVPDEVYNSFLGQELVSTGYSLDPTGPPITVFGGDMSVCVYTFNTYGWSSSLNAGGFDDGSGVPAAELGNRFGRRFICESVSNINLRYTLPSNIYSFWLPNNPMAVNSGYMIDWNRTIDPNQFGYNKDLNAINDLVVTSVFNPNVSDISQFPYRVHRGGKFKVEGKQRRSWRTFLPLDYYEMPKNLGPVYNLEGYDDRLLIHMRNALFITQDKAQMSTSPIAVTLGTGDIFQFNPKEALDYSLGYAGTQHKLACKKLPIGYTFIDAERGQVFIYQGELVLKNEGLDIFLRQFLRKVTDQDNSFNGNGVTIGYDPDFERILFTVKNKQLLTGSSDFVPGYVETPEFFATLTPNVSIVYKDGRYQKFLGVNPFVGIYDCIENQAPILGNYSASFDQDTITGTLILTAVATDGNPPLNYYITGGNPGFFSLSALGELILTGTPIPGVYVMNTKVIDVYGLSDTGTITITVTATPQAPIIGTVFNLNDPELMDTNTPLTLIPISNSADGPFTATIFGDPIYDPMFSANTTDFPGNVVVKTTALFGVHGTPADPANGVSAVPFTRTIHVKVANAADPSKFAIADVNFTFGIVESPPKPTPLSVSIIETAAAGAVVATLTVIDSNEPPVPITPYVYEIIYQDEPWFVIGGILNNQLLVAPTIMMNPYERSLISVWVKATDYTGRSGVSEMLITISEDPATLEDQPYDFICEPDTTPLPPTSSVDFLVFDILLDNPDHATDAVDTLGYLSTVGKVETNAQVDRVVLRQLPATSDANASYFASERYDAGGSNTLYRYLIDYGRLAVTNPGITTAAFRIHLKVTNGSGTAGSNRIYFSRQAGGVKQMPVSSPLVPSVTGSTVLDTTLIQPEFPTGTAGPLDIANVPAFIEVTYNYSTFVMTYTLL